MHTSVETYLAGATQKLHAAGIESARLDALILLEDALGTDRSIILAHPERKLDAQTEAELNTKIAQRARQIPLAYLRGKAMFYGREFAITPDVLVPRPETESMLALYKTLLLSGPAHVADVGTGSGCIGITVALESPGVQVDLYDIDPIALSIATANARALGITARFYAEDLLSDANGRRYDVVCANLPYVPDDYPINDAAKHEPALALFAGPDGLDLYRLLFSQLASQGKEKPLHIITEALPEQHRSLAALAKAAGYTLNATSDYVQHFTC